jgi:ParB family chromosome partitioning protein
LGHARALIGLSPSKQQAFATSIHEEGWSVRRLEEAVRLSKLSAQTTPPPSPNTDVIRLQSELSEYMGTPVKIDTDEQQGGWLKIKFFDNDTLAGLLERMGMEID